MERAQIAKGHLSRDIARERKRVVDSAPTWNCFADKPVLLASVAAYRAVVPRWTCASRPCVLRASCVNRSFSVVEVFVKRFGAPPPSVTMTTRRPFVSAPRALFMPLPAMLEGTRRENHAARGCACREPRDSSKKENFGANDESPLAVGRTISTISIDVQALIWRFK